jgi:hypothetical protein
MVDRASAARARSNRISPRGRAAMTRLELITSTLPASAGVAATREYQAVDCFEILCELHGSSLPAATREQVAAIAPHPQAAVRYRRRPRSGRGDGAVGRACVRRPRSAGTNPSRMTVRKHSPARSRPRGRRRQHRGVGVIMIHAPSGLECASASATKPAQGRMRAPNRNL